MITSLKIAKVVHLTALKFATAKSVIGIGALVAAGATGMVATEHFEPDYIDATVALVARSIDAETGLSTQGVASESVLPTLGDSQQMNPSDARATIATGVTGINLRKIRPSNEVAEEISVAQ